MIALALTAAALSQRALTSAAPSLSSLSSSVSFASPALLWLAALPALVALGFWLWDRQQRALLMARLGDAALIARLTAAASPRRRGVKLVLVVLAATALTIAVARPQVQGTREVEIRGLDVVIALDVSTSMTVEDIAAAPEDSPASNDPPRTRPGKPDRQRTRLELARRLIAALVGELPGDRIGPVVFAAAAAHFPLTEDHEVALQFFTDLGPGDLPQGSNLAEALRVSQCLLRRDLAAEAGCSATIGRRGDGGRPRTGEADEDQPIQGEDADEQEEQLVEREERGRVIVVVSDGEESQDSGMATREVQKARELGIAVVFVGVGSLEGGQVFDLSADGKSARPKRDDDGALVTSRRGDAAMRALAAAAGDPTRYLVAEADANPAPITLALERVSRGLATRKTRQKRDVFHPLVFAAILLLAIDAALGTRRRRRYPEASTGEAATRGRAP